MKYFNDELKILSGVGCMMFFAFIFFMFIASKMFEYSLWFITGKDVPWYLDIAGGFVLNGINVPLWIVCLIMNACGVDQPFINNF